MYRLLVALLAAFDALIAVAVGIAAALAPLGLVWVFGLGSADWAALWPASAAVWQLGHLVPLDLTLPGEYLATAGIPTAAATFALTLAPLAFAGFTALFAARSGARAAQADAWITGVVTASGAVAVLATLIALTTANGVVTTELWQAVAFPTLVFALPATAGAIAAEWREAGSGAIARLRDRAEALPGAWAAVPALAVRATAMVVVGLVGLGGLAVAVAAVLRGGQVIALFEAANVDAVGATVMALAQLAYLPTLAIWGVAFIAGPGFSLGAGSAVSPAGTQVSVLPGLPVLGIVPESVSSWLLLLALLPVALGVLAGWMARSRLAALAAPPETEPVRMAAIASDAASPRLDALRTLLPPRADTTPTPSSSDLDTRAAPRLVLAVAIAVLSAAAAAGLAALASGSIGPGRLAEVGPSPGPVALAVGAEVLVGAGILLLAPVRRARRDAADDETDADAGRSPWWTSAKADPVERETPGEPEDAASETRFDGDDQIAADLARVWAIPRGSAATPEDTTSEDANSEDATAEGDTPAGDTAQNDTAGDDNPEDDTPAGDAAEGGTGGSGTGGGDTVAGTAGRSDIAEESDTAPLAPLDLPDPGPPAPPPRARPTPLPRVD